MSRSKPQAPDEQATVVFTDPDTVTLLGERRRQIDSQEPTVLFGPSSGDELRKRQRDQRRVGAMRDTLRARQAQRENLARHLMETLTEEERAHPVKVPTDPPMEG